jgi:hypothetical protein
MQDCKTSPKVLTIWQIFTILVTLGEQFHNSIIICVINYYILKLPRSHVKVLPTHATPWHKLYLLMAF